MTRVISAIDELRSLVGQQVSESDWFEVSQSRIDAFADATLDHQWIHVDSARAQAESPFGRTIAHGFLTLSLLSHLVRQAVKVEVPFQMGINYGLNRVRFPAPAPVGSRFRARLALQSVDEQPEHVQIIWAATVEVEGGKKPAMAAEWVVRYYR